VLGGVHGAAGRGGTGSTRRPRVLEPVPRRRRVRWKPVLAAAAVVVALAAGAVAWIASRSYVVEESPDGNVQVAHGLPFDALGLDLSSSWQEIGVPAATVRESEPEALSQGAQGQGEAVGDAAGLVWRYALPETPAVRTPARDTAPESPPAPAGEEPSPG
jgi:hypothetical protein